MGRCGGGIFAVVSAAWLMVGLVATPIRAAESEKPQAGGKPNIVFIMADDLGYGHLGSYGGEKIETPNIDRLAAQGMKFTQAYAGAGVCAPSRSVLMTGMHVGHTRIRSNGQGMYLFAVDVTIPEMLDQAGYTTGYFGKWGLGLSDNPGAPWRQGVDEFFGQLHHIHAHFQYPAWLWHNDEHYPLFENWGERENRYASDVIHKKAEQFIRTHYREPFFAFISYTIPHVELVVPEESEKPYRDDFPKVPIPDPREEYLASEHGYATYAGMISRLDMYVGQIMDLLDELGIEQNTLVIFTSDNGPQGGGLAWDKLVKFFNGNGPLRGAKASLYEGGIRVPLIARWPGHIKPGTVSNLPIYFPDVMPTLADVAGATVPTNIDGISFLPTLLGKKQQEKHEFMYWARCNPNGPPISQAVRMGKWKAIKPGRNAEIELYNLARDINESNNVAEEHPEIVQRMHHYMKRAWTERYNFGPAPAPGRSDYVW